MSELEPARPRRRGYRSQIIVAGVLALIVIPASIVLGSHRFSDVSTSNPIHGAVSALANSGITSGCTATRYCPGSNVTRGQMAVFMTKLGALDGTTPPVVDALSTNGYFVQGGIEEFTLAGGAASECETTNASAEGINPFGSYSISYHLFDVAETGGSINPELVNIQLRDSDAPADVNDNVFQVCFATTDGTNLPAGTYKTFFNFMVFIGQGLFASQSTSSAATAVPARQR